MLPSQNNTYLSLNINNKQNKTKIFIFFLPTNMMTLLLFIFRFSLACKYLRVSNCFLHEQSLLILKIYIYIIFIFFHCKESSTILVAQIIDFLVCLALDLFFGRLDGDNILKKNFPKVRRSLFLLSFFCFVLSFFFFFGYLSL